MEQSYQDRFVTVLGHKMHYLEAGNHGSTVLFLHGMPTSSYLWRHVIEQIAPQAHCIAVDLIGMGQSDRPDIDYRVFDHIDYFNGFVEALGLTDITLVMHGWGSVIGFAFAQQHPEKIRAMAFYESHLRAPQNEEMLSLPVQQLASLLAHDDASYTAVVEHDYLVEKLLPRGALTKLPEDAMHQYRQPFATVESRKPLWQYVLDLPLGKQSTDVSQLINSYSHWLQTTRIPKLLMYAWPGFITTMQTVSWAKEAFPALTSVDVGEGLHFIQESNPEAFCHAFLAWFMHLPE